MFKENFKLSLKNYTTIFIILLIASSVRIAISSSKSEITKEEIFQPVVEKLINAGVDSSFVFDLIKNENVEFKEKYVKINVVGKYSPPDYSSHYNSRAVRNSKKFLADNTAILEKAEMEYGVPKEVITSILYVETRHGNYLGYNNIASVFLSTALASEEKYYWTSVARGYW